MAMQYWMRQVCSEGMHDNRCSCSTKHLLCINFNSKQWTKQSIHSQLIGNKCAPIQLTQCWFPGLAIFRAKIYFSDKVYQNNFIKIAPRNRYSLKLPKCWLPLKENNFTVSLIIILAGTLSFPADTAAPTAQYSLAGGSKQRDCWRLTNGATSERDGDELLF